MAKTRRKNFAVFLILAIYSIVYAVIFSKTGVNSTSKRQFGLSPLGDVNGRMRTYVAGMCNQTRLDNIVKIRQDLKSNCPEKTQWWLPFAGYLSEGQRQPLIHVNIGCNKGFDFLATLEDLSGDKRYSPGAYRQRLEEAGIMFSGDGACRQIVNLDTRLRPQLSSIRKVIGHCIEPAQKTFQVLERGFKDLQGIHLGQYVLGAFLGDLFFPDVDAGKESKGFSKTEGISIRATTLDDYAGRMGITNIDLLSIDTEGNDVNVLYGAINLLNSHSVRVLEFEVHTRGQWAVSRVDNVIAMLQNLGFICYWQLNGKYPILRATGCMAEALESKAVKAWSNMVCANEAERGLLDIFEALSVSAETALQTESTDRDVHEGKL